LTAKTEKPYIIAEKLNPPAAKEITARMLGDIKTKPTISLN
jgi:hypothetical protein